MMPIAQDVTLLSAGSGYARRRKELLALVKRLRASGAHADLDLPRVAVVGNQSAGKSSLVEAISGITVPRDAGTCTRCPMECRLSSSTEPWRCQVSIRFEFDSSGKRRNEVQEVTFGGVIKDKSEVELMLRRAQTAVLNPDIATGKFVTMSAENLNDTSVLQKKRLPFSKNVVCIDLAGPELTDLSFIDLPGIIQNADPEIVQLVESLVMSHIKGNCLILVTCPMSDDIDNQKALRLARDADPSGLRTIGVLTKPDTLTAGAIKQRENWLGVLEGRNVQHRLTHGYFCTRQPDDADRRAGITTVQARASEATFFAKTAPWQTSTHQHRFGTQNLVKTLSTLLTNIIDDAIPKLQKEVVQQLSTCRAELDTLPPAITSDPSSYVLNLITSFCGVVDAYVQGDSTTASLVQGNRGSYAVFKRAIRSTAPAFLPFPSASEAPAHAMAYLKFDVEEDEFEVVGGESEDVPSGKSMYLRDIKDYIAQSITRELPNNVPYPAKVALIKQFQSSWPQLCQDVFDHVGRDYQDMLINLMRDKFQRYGLLHSRVNVAVQELLKTCRDATLLHLQSLLKLESTPFTQNSHYLADKTAKTLARFKDARSGKDVMTNEIRRFQARRQTGAPSKRARQRDNESEGEKRASGSAFKVGGSGTSGFGQPFLFSKTSMPASAIPAATSSRPSTSAAASPSSARGPSPSPAEAPEDAEVAAERENMENEALALLTKLGYKGLKVEDLGKLNPPDEFEDELQVMAEVRAYFHVAYKRVIDYIPLSIDHLFLYGLSESLQAALIEKLGLGTVKSAERCAAYLSEDANVVAARTELLGKKDRLEAVQNELDNFMYA